MRYRLRTLLIVLAVVPALIGGTYWLWFEFEKSRHQAYYDGKRWYIHPDNVPPGHHLEVDKENRNNPWMIVVPDAPTPQNSN
jgi:hypothetical protein